MGEAAHGRRNRTAGLGLSTLTQQHTTRRRATAPFRADHVGSLLRTAALKAARGRRERGEIGADELRAVEDEEIVKLIRRQEAVGLGSITDGEYRRASWQTDFLVALPGVESYHGEHTF